MLLEQGEIVSTLRRALVHISDPEYLESLPLLTEIIPQDEAGLSRGQYIQRALRLAIDQLAPGSGNPGALDPQSYEVLYQYTLSRRNMAGIAAQLGMSERQGYRVLRNAVNALAQVLLANEDASQGRNGSTQVREEVQRLLTDDASLLDAYDLLHEAIEAILPLARERNVHLEIEWRAGRPRITASRVLVRQALINLISDLCGRALPDTELRISAAPTLSGSTTLCFTYQGDAPDAFCDAQSPLAVARQILQLVGIEHMVTSNGIGHAITLEFTPSSQSTVLIVDDNDDLVALFRRYLQAMPVRVCSARDYANAIAQVRELQPEVVILDIMLPGRDGWELLHALRQTRDGVRPRIIVCSVINDPELSSSMGADAFLKKPVTQRVLVDTVYRVLRERV